MTVTLLDTSSRSFRIQCEGALERIEEGTRTCNAASHAIEAGSAFQLDLSQLEVVTKAAIDQVARKLELEDAAEGREALRAWSQAKERLRLVATKWARGQGLLVRTDDLAALVDKAQTHLPITWSQTGGVPRTLHSGTLVGVLSVTSLVCVLLGCVSLIRASIQERPLGGAVWFLAPSLLLYWAQRRPFQRGRLTLTRSSLLVGDRDLPFSDIAQVSLHESTTNKLEVDVVLRAGGRVKIKPANPDEFVAAAAHHLPVEVTPATLARRRVRDAPDESE